MTALEFICAQAPLRLKGLLIGIWYASLAGGHVLQLVESGVARGEGFLDLSVACVCLNFIAIICEMRW